MWQSALQAGNSDTRALVLISLCATATHVRSGSDFFRESCGDIQQTKEITCAYPFALHSDL